MAKYTIIFVFSVLSGLAFLVLACAGHSNSLFLWALPLAWAVLALMIINPLGMVITFLFVRVPLEPFLDMSRLGEGGMGVGAALNLVMILLGSYFVFRGPRPSAMPGAKSGSLFLIVAFLSCFYSPVFLTGMRLFVDFSTYAVMLAIPFFVIRSDRDIQFWLKLLFWASILPVAAANIDMVLGGLHGGRVQGFFHHPNQMAFYSVYVLALCFMVLQGGFFVLSGFKKKLILLFMADVFTILLTTQTRSAWFALWIAVVIYGILKERKYLWIALALPCLALLHPAVQSRIADLFQGNIPTGYEKLNSFAWRKELWKSALPVILQQPWLGHGLSSFKPMCVHFFKYAGPEGSGAHNVFVELAFETGFVGVALFMGLFAQWLGHFFAAVKRMAGIFSKRYAIMFSYLLGYLIVCASDNLLQYLVVNWYFLFFTGLMLKTAGFQFNSLPFFQAPAPAMRKRPRIYRQRVSALERCH